MYGVRSGIYGCRNSDGSGSGMLLLVVEGDYVFRLSVAA